MDYKLKFSIVFFVAFLLVNSVLAVAISNTQWSANKENKASNELESAGETPGLIQAEKTSDGDALKEVKKPE